ncbi:MAG: PQQ-binding-like beta-propeller repeat protein [Bacteroidia bacterium]|nr:PQQ-binding-like beta-propeller repeat protein [Bacteroidia bacterium]
MSGKKHIQVEQIASYKGHTGSVFALAHDREESFLYSSGDDGIIAQWDLSQESPDAVALLRSDRAVYSLAISEDGGLLFAGSSDGTLYVYDLIDKKLLQTVRKTADSIYHLHSEGDFIWICQGGGFLTCMDTRNGKEHFFGRLTEENLRIMIPALNEGRYYIGASDNYIYEFDSLQGKILNKWSAHNNSVFSLLLHPDGKYLLSGSRDAHFNVWDLQNSHSQIRSVPAHNFTINYFALSPDGNYFLTASRDKTIKLWDAYDFSLLKVIDFLRNQAHTHSVNKIFWLKSDNSFISCGDDRKILRWKLTLEA